VFYVYALSLASTSSLWEERDGITVRVYNDHGDRRTVLMLSHWREYLIRENSVTVLPRKV
jgi:hypothetical protein